MNEKLKYYAWEACGVVVYTLEETPVAGDAVYTSVNTAGPGLVDVVREGFIVVGRVVYGRQPASDAETSLYHPIITVKEMASITRQEYIDDDKLGRIIHESEMLYVKPAIGNEIYLRLITNPVSEDCNTLLDGGVYSLKGKRFQFEGLKTALAYYAFARSAKSSIIPTRYGTVEKKSEYSNQAVLTERQKLIRETFEVADRYLKDCVNYIVANPDTFPGFKPGKMRSPHSINFRIIGES